MMPTSAQHSAWCRVCMCSLNVSPCYNPWNLLVLNAACVTVVLETHLKQGLRCLRDSCCSPLSREGAVSVST